MRRIRIYTHKGNSIEAMVVVDSRTLPYSPRRRKTQQIEIESYSSDSDSDSADEEHHRTKILRLLPRKCDGRKDEVDDLYGQEKTLVVAPFCDLSHPPRFVERRGAGLEAGVETRPGADVGYDEDSRRRYQ